MKQPFMIDEEPKKAQFSLTATVAPLTLDGSDLAQLSKLMGRNIADVDDLKLAARNLTTLSVEGLEDGDITLDTYLLNRLKSRCHPTEHFPTFLRDRIKELLSGYAGC